MAKWGEIKCARCAELEERLEAAQRDAKEAEAYAEELEAKRQEAFQMYVDANEARIDAEAERDALAEKLAKAVETEMVRVCSAYAKDNNMTAATAVHDAWLCVQITIAELTSGEATTPVGREGDKDE